MAAFRIAHLSDIHVWEWTLNPVRLMSKRAVGMTALLLGRARRFRQERLAAVVEKVASIRPDHVLITGDLTTTSMREEFARAHDALRPLLRTPERATVIPGNHDRYTRRATRGRHFEHAFGRFAGGVEYPWLRFIADRTAVLALDPCRPAVGARGLLPEEQLAAARELWEDHHDEIDRLIVACHYPVDAPEGLRDDLAWKPLVNADELADWLATLGPHLFCCGHVHNAWAFTPPRVPDELCLNAGAPLLVDREGDSPPGFLEITLDGADVAVVHHGWDGSAWVERPLAHREGFLDPTRRRVGFPLGE
ncbi:metallophosphoesterase [Paludisphaera sp.]|uniref:metallophosphoesterase family protein n=1 Tax=Paludisphaera sp. TaxID=2017432 RepID=UPI00301D4123